MQSAIMSWEKYIVVKIVFEYELRYDAYGGAPPQFFPQTNAEKM